MKPLKYDRARRKYIKTNDARRSESKYVCLGEICLLYEY